MTAATIPGNRGLLIGLGLAELLATVLASRVISRDETYLGYLLAYLGMGVVWLAATHYVVSRGDGGRSQRAIILGFAIAMRLVLLPTAPVLSDDIFRYIWDGRVQQAGINPYRYAPEAEELASLRDPESASPHVFASVNNKDIPTIYPPFMQMTFLAVTMISESVTWMKLVFVLFDLALIFVLSRLLRTLGKSPSRVIVYAWSPLVLVEVAASGHNDVLATFCLMGALAAVLAHRARIFTLLLTLSGLAKIVGITLAPLFLRRIRWRSWLWVPATAALVTLPYASAGTLAFRGITQYGLRWRGNDGLFHVLYALTGSLETAKVIVAATLVGFVLLLVALDASPLRASYLTLGAILLLTTTVHPWYLLWMAPFLAFYPSPAWLFLSLSVGLSYHSAYLATPGEPWEDLIWVKCLEYVPFFALAAASALRSLRQGPPSLRSLLGLHSRP